MILNFFRNTNFSNRKKKLFSEYSKKNITSQKVLMHIGIGKMFLTPFEILFYHILKKEGFMVDYLIYDHQIPINELMTLERYEKYGDNLYKRNFENAKNTLENANVKYQVIDSLNSQVIEIIQNIPPKIEKILNYKYDGINFGFIVQNNLNRFYKSTKTLNINSEIALKYLQTSLINYFEIKNRFKKKNYDYVLFSHGINVTWGPVRIFCEKNNIKYFSYDRAKTEGTINFNYNRPAPIWNIDDVWSKNSKRDLNKIENEILNQYLNDRELQKNDTFRYNTRKKVKNYHRLRKKLKISNDSKLITIYTNLIWDATAVSESLIFETFTDCILETINYFKEKNSIHILIRSHPAEKVLSSNEYYKDLIIEKLGGKIPNNVSFTPNDTTINSFSIIELTDVAIVNTSTIGLECAILDKPVVLPFKCHYGNKGFTDDPETKKSYFDIIESHLKRKNKRKNRSILAKKYFFLMMFKYQKKTPIEYKNNLFKKYTFLNLDDLSKNDQIYELVKKIKQNDINNLTVW